MTKQKIKHICPYLEKNGLICTHNSTESYSGKRRCGFHNMYDCPILRDSKSIITQLDIKDTKIDLRAVETPKNTILGRDSE